MPDIDIVDSTWVGADPAATAAALIDATNWRRWWPALDLTVQESRGAKGVRWLVEAVRDDGAGAATGLSGTAEVWLQPVSEGLVAHFFLRLDAAPGRTLSRRESDRIRGHYRRLAKTAFWAISDSLDLGRRARLSTTAHIIERDVTTADRSRESGADSWQISR